MTGLPTEEENMEWFVLPNLNRQYSTDETPWFEKWLRGFDSGSKTLDLIRRIRRGDRGKVTLSEFKAMRLNTYERNALHAHLDDEALVYVTEYAIKNCARSPFSTYDWALKELHVPELLKRLKALGGIP